MESPPRRTAWADLLQRVFEVDVLRCPVCGRRMRVLSAITNPEVACRILECLELPARAPPLGRVGAGGAEIDRAGLTEPDSLPIGEAEPAFDFDQSPPADDWT